MIELSDDLLNKYLDGELDEKELAEVLDFLVISKEAQKRLKALQIADKGLRQIKEFKVPDAFTDLVMSKLHKRSKVRKGQKYFIFSISSIFILSSLTVLGFIISLFMGTDSESDSTSHILENFLNYADYLSKSIKGIMSGENISIFGSIISFVIIISAYFFFENYKQTKEKLSKLP